MLHRLYYNLFSSPCKLLFIGLCKYFVKQYGNKDYYPYYNKNAYHSDREVTDICYKINRIKIHYDLPLHKEIEYQSARDYRGYLTRYINADGLH